MSGSDLMFAGNLVLHLGALLCFIALVVEMFRHDETSWGVACLVLFFCGCGQLIAVIYGWTKVGDWDIGLLMVAASLCVVGGIIQVAIMVATTGLPVR